MFEVLLKVLEEDNFLSYSNKITIAAVIFFYADLGNLFTGSNKSWYTETKGILLYFTLLFESNGLHRAVT